MRLEVGTTVLSLCLKGSGVLLGLNSGFVQEIRLRTIEIHRMILIFLKGKYKSYSAPRAKTERFSTIYGSKSPGG
jgi:hypothetical protein